MTHEHSIEQLSERTGIALPDDVRILSLETEESGDRAIFAKLAVSAPRLDAFLEAVEVVRDELEEGARVYLGPDREGWDPGVHESLPSAQRLLPGGEVLNVGFSCLECDEVVVYLMWHET